MKLEHFLKPHTKLNSKWMKDLNYRPDTIKLLRENTGRTLFGINHREILFDPPPGAMEIKTKINNWELIKLKSFLHSKGNYKQGKKSDRENITANEATDKGLTSKIHKQFIQLLKYQKNKPTNQKEKIGRRSKQTLLQIYANG